MRKEHRKLKDLLGSKGLSVSYLLSNTDITLTLVSQVVSQNDVHSLHR